MPYASGCLALADTELDLRTARTVMPSMTNVTICVATAQGVGRMTGVPGADWLPQTTSGAALYAIDRAGNIVACVSASVAKRGVPRVGIGGMVERTKTGGGGFGTGTGLLPDPSDKVVASKHTDGCGTPSQ